MSSIATASGKRWVEAAVEVPGTQEEVWEAIATGPGISAWFVPTEFHTTRKGRPDRVLSHFGPDASMDSVAHITLWEPPSRFVAESADLGPDAPKIITEWRVEPHPGETTRVSVRHTLETDSNAWDAQLTAWEAGWPDFFHILRLYLTYFRGQPCSSFQLVTAAPAPVSRAWDQLTSALGIDAMFIGARHELHPGAPPLAGLVEVAEEGEHPEQVLIRLDTPAPGMAHCFALAMDHTVHVILRFYLYGDQGRKAVMRDEPLWRAWLEQHFPADGLTAEA